MEMKTKMLLRSLTKNLSLTLREPRECLMRCLAIASYQKQSSVQSRPSMRKNAWWATFYKLSQFRNSSRKSFSMMIWSKKWRLSLSLESERRGMSYKEWGSRRKSMGSLKLSWYVRGAHMILLRSALLISWVMIFIMRSAYLDLSRELIWLMLNKILSMQTIKTLSIFILLSMITLELLLFPRKRSPLLLLRNLLQEIMVLPSAVTTI